MTLAYVGPVDSIVLAFYAGYFVGNIEVFTGSFFAFTWGTFLPAAVLGLPGRRVGYPGVQGVTPFSTILILPVFLVASTVSSMPWSLFFNSPPGVWGTNSTPSGIRCC